MQIEAKLDRIIALLEQVMRPSPATTKPQVTGLLSVADVARRLGISPRSAHRLVKEMPHVRVFSSVRVTEKALSDYVLKRTVVPVPWSPHDRVGRIKRTKLTGPVTQVPTKEDEASSSWRRQTQPRTNRAPGDTSSWRGGKKR